jgi:hypothetical protein
LEISSILEDSLFIEKSDRGILLEYGTNCGWHRSFFVVNIYLPCSEILFLLITQYKNKEDLQYDVIILLQDITDILIQDMLVDAQR